MFGFCGDGKAIHLSNQLAGIVGVMHCYYMLPTGTNKTDPTASMSRPIDAFVLRIQQRRRYCVRGTVGIHVGIMFTEEVVTENLA